MTRDEKEKMKQKLHTGMELEHLALKCVRFQ